MGKDKKKRSKKNEVAQGILDVAAISVQKFRKVTKEIGKLSTGQKLVGGLTLVAAGLTYLAKQNADKRPATSPDVPRLTDGEADTLPQPEAEIKDKPAHAHKGRKGAKTKHDA